MRRYGELVTSSDCAAIHRGFSPAAYRDQMDTVPVQYDAVTIVASLGGIKAISRILSALPRDFPVPVLVVQHRSSALPSLLPTILQRETRLHVKLAENNEAPQPGYVYVAPPNKHMTIGLHHTLQLQDGRRIRHLLSAGDPLFISAAMAYKSGVIAVVLTGLDANGAAGVTAVKQAGGVVIAQDQATSEAFAMPRAAIATGCVDFILPIEQIGPELAALARRGVQATA